MNDIKKNGLIFVKILISVVLIFLTLKKIGANESLNEILTANPFLVITAATLFLVSYFIGATQWWMILRSNNIDIEWNKALSFYFIGLFFNNFLPSSLGGDVFRMIDIKRFSADSSAAVSTVFIDRFAGLFAMSAMAMLTSPLFMSNASFPVWLQVLFISLPFAWILLLFFLFNKQFAKPFTTVIERFLPKRVTAKGREIYNNIYNFGRKPKFALKIIGIAVCVQLCRITTIYMLARSLDIVVSPVPFIMFIPIIAIAAAAPVSVGGIGVREALGIILFSTVLSDGNSAAVFLFMAYIIAIITSIPGGVIFAIRTKQIKRGNK